MSQISFDSLCCLFLMFCTVLKLKSTCRCFHISLLLTRGLYILWRGYIYIHTEYNTYINDKNDSQFASKHRRHMQTHSKLPSNEQSWYLINNILKNVNCSKNIVNCMSSKLILLLCHLVISVFSKTISENVIINMCAHNLMHIHTLGTVAYSKKNKKI